MVFMLEIHSGTNIKSEYEKVRKSAELSFKKMFLINPNRLKGLNPLVILLYDPKKGTES